MKNKFQNHYFCLSKLKKKYIYIFSCFSIVFFVFLDFHVSRPKAWSQDKIHRPIDWAKRPKAWSDDKMKWPTDSARNIQNKETMKNNRKTKNILNISF